MKTKIAALSLLLLSSSAMSASSNITTTVTFVGMYGDGRLFVGLDESINEPGCAGPRFDVEPQHSANNQWLEIARTARETGRSVVIRTNGCFAGRPTMDHTTNSWFYLK